MSLPLQDIKGQGNSYVILVWQEEISPASPHSWEIIVYAKLPYNSYEIISAQDKLKQPLGHPAPTLKSMIYFITRIRSALKFYSLRVPVALPRE